jgi:hypothetical protein
MPTRSTVLTAVTVMTVALLLVVALVWSRPGTAPTDPEPGPGPAAGAAGRSTTSSPRALAPVGRSDARVRAAEPAAVARPVRVIMPSTDIAAPLRSVGVAPDGQMEIPPNPRVMGWYRFGAVPGERSGGSVVLAGHLDSKRFGLGPLARLRDMRPGDPVEVALADGTRRSYRVTRLERFDRQALPAFLFSRTGPDRLRVITCGGEYDADAGGYQQNLVVTAVPDPNRTPGGR